MAFRVTILTRAQLLGMGRVPVLDELLYERDFNMSKWGDGATAYAALPYTSADLADATVDSAASATLLASINSCITDSTRTYTAPAPASTVSHPPLRFGVRNDTTVAIQFTMPNKAGTSLTITVLPGQSHIYHQSSTSGFSPEGGTPLKATDDRYKPMPTYVPATAKNNYDRRFAIYNAKPSNTRKLKAMIDKVRSGGTGHAVMLGESTTAGYDGTALNSAKSWPSVMAAALQRALAVPFGGDGIINMIDATGQDYRLSGTGGMTSYGAFLGTTSGGTVTARQTKLGATSITVTYDDASGKNNFTYSVDGGAAQSVTIGSTNAIKSFTVSGLSATQLHTITITCTGTDVFYTVAFTGAGLHVHNVARSSSGLAQGGEGTGVSGVQGGWLDTSQYYSVGQQAWAALAASNIVADVVFSAQGINDLYPSTSYPNGPRTPAQAVADIQTEVTAARFSGTDKVLILQPRLNNMPATNWDPFSTLMYQLADTLDCVLIDFRDRMGDTDIMSTNGLLGADGFHPGVAGMDEEARAVLTALFDGLATADTATVKQVVDTTTALITPFNPGTRYRWTPATTGSGSLPYNLTDPTLVIIENQSASNTVTYARGGATDTIEGSTGTFTLQPGEAVELTYSPLTTTWYQRRFLWSPTPGTQVRRDPTGRAQVAAPNASGDIAIKATVDGARAPVNPTSTNFAYPRINLTSSAAAATSGTAHFQPLDVSGSGYTLDALITAVTTAQVAGTGTLSKVAVYADNGSGTGPLLTAAGLLRQSPITTSSTGTKTNSLSPTLPVTAGRYWLCSFYYQGSVAPTTAPQFTSVATVTSELPTNAFGSLTRSLTVTGLTDLPVGSQTLIPNTTIAPMLVAARAV